MRCPPGTAIILLALAGAVAGCTDSAGPPLAVSVALASTGAPQVTYLNGQQYMQCGVQLTASANGAGSLGWGDAVIRFYAAGDTVPFDTATVDSATVQQAWQDSRIAGGQHEQSGWNIWAGVPYRAVMVFRLLGRGDRVAATATTPMISCGAAAPAAPPSITSLTLTAPAAYEPGTIIYPQFTAQSSTGLWESALILDGACHVEHYFDEGLATSATHVVEMDLPRTCKLGATITLTAVAWDGALQGGGRQVVLGYITDHHAPGVSVGQGSSATAEGGEYLVGETDTIGIYVTDNHALARLAWKLLPSGPADSMPLASDTGVVVRLPITDSLAGLHDFRVIAVDSSGNADTAVTTGGALEFVKADPVQNPAGPLHIASGGRAIDAVFDQKRGTVYLLQEYVISTVSRTAAPFVASTTYLPGWATSFDITPGGDSLVIGWHNLHTLGIVDLRTMDTSELAIAWPDSMGPAPNVDLVRTLANGRAIVLMGDGYWAQVDLSTGATVTPWRAWSGGFGKSYDGARVVWARNGALVPYDIAADTFGTAVAEPAYAASTAPWLDATGAYLSSGCHSFDHSLRYLATMHGGLGYCPGSSTQMAPDGSYYLYGSGPVGAYRVRTSDGARIDAIRMPYPTMMRVSPDGHWLIAAQQDCCGGPNLVTVYDLSQLAPVATAAAAPRALRR